MMRGMFRITLLLLVNTNPIICYSVKSPLQTVRNISSLTNSRKRFTTFDRIHAQKDDDKYRDASEDIKNEDEQNDLRVGGSPSSASPPVKKNTSKRQMLSFAIPALGIYLSNPLLSNIDNAFVGRTAGTQGLAALSPATICTDQMIYLFSFLSRATTGLVSRAYGLEEKNVEAAKEAGSPPLTVALFCGFLLSIFYFFFTPSMLSMLNVNPELRPSAASYIYFRGAIAWAALSQNVALSVMMSTKDSITPLKIIGLAAVVNIVGDALLCVWPLQLGCTGAAAATAFATLLSSGFMVRALKKKNILPDIKVPTKKQFADLMEFTGPLFAITITRLFGFINMQRTAMKLGVQHLAAYQLSINVVIFFLLFGEPLSQLSQTELPSLIDKGDSLSIKATLKSVLLLGALGSLGVGAVAGILLYFGSGIFSSDIIVQNLAKGAAPAVFMTVATAIFTVTVDGAMLASRDFTYMLVQGTLSMLLQLKLLSWCTNISDIYATFTLRLGGYAMIALARVALGRGKLGSIIRKGKPTLPSPQALA